MPLITPKDIRDYTSFNDVRRRTDFQLEYDILMAEQEIFRYCGHKFDDKTKYPKIPIEVKLACIKLAEYNALINGDESFVKGYKSINLAGELQYQLPGGEPVDKTYLQNLLHEHVQDNVNGGNNIIFRMRFL